MHELPNDIDLQIVQVPELAASYYTIPHSVAIFDPQYHGSTSKMLEAGVHASYYMVVLNLSLKFLGREPQPWLTPWLVHRILAVNYDRMAHLHIVVWHGLNISVEEIDAEIVKYPALLARSNYVLPFKIPRIYYK